MLEIRLLKYFLAVAREQGLVYFSRGRAEGFVDFIEKTVVKLSAETREIIYCIDTVNYKMRAI